MEFSDKEIESEIDNPKFEFRELILDYKALFTGRGFLTPAIFITIGSTLLLVLLKYDTTLSLALFLTIGFPSFLFGIGYCLWPFTARLLIPFILFVLGLAKMLLFKIWMLIFAIIKLYLVQSLLRQRKKPSMNLNTHKEFDVN